MSVPSTTFRYYQRDAIESTTCAWFDDKRNVLQMPTGSGKTLTCAELIRLGLPERSLFLADQDELCDQPLGAFKRIMPHMYPSIEKGKQRASLAADIVIASSQTLSKKNRLDRFPRNHFKRIFVDEAHRGTDRDFTVCEYFDEALVCAMTATPFRANVRDLTKWYPGIAYRMKPTDFVELGFAPPERTINLPVEIDLAGVKASTIGGEKDYDARGASSAIEPYFDQIAEAIKEQVPHCFGIAYLPLIEISKNFAACLRRHGITAYHVDGQMSDRDSILEHFQRREFSWLVNCGVISTGVDIPIADCFLCLRPTRSHSFYQQARGRTWRVLPGIIDHLPEKDQAAERRRLIAASAKPESINLDLLWLNDELGVVHPGDMYAESEYDARQIFEKTKGKDGMIDLMEVARQVREEREQAVIEALERAAIKTGGNRVQAGHVGALIGDARLATYEPMAAWESQPLSDAQKNALANFGVDPESVGTKGFAKSIMDSLGFRIRMGLATLKQVRLIKQYNETVPGPLRVPNVEGLTMNEASIQITRIVASKRGL